MPTIQSPLISYEETVSEPIKVQILSLIDDNINYINSSGNKLTNSDGISLTNANESTVVINEIETGHSGLTNTVTNSSSRYSIIYDNEIGLDIKVADVEKEFKISISKRFHTRGEAIWWRNSIIGNMRDGTTNRTTAIAVSPCISNRILTLIELCRTLKVRRDREDRDFMEYLLGISVDTISIDTNSDSSSVAVLFPEAMDGVVFSLPSEVPNVTVDDGDYIMEVEASTTLKVPTSVIVKYPTFIGGKRLPREMLDLSMNVNDDEAYNSRCGILENLLTFKGTEVSAYRDYCYQLPSYECYMFPFKSWNLAPIFQIRVSGELNNPRHVVNLKDLFVGDIGGITLDPLILEYFIANRDIILSPVNSAVSIVLIKDGDRITSNRLYVDGDMNLRTVYDIDMLGDYHLAITTMLQTATIPEKTFETVREHPELVNRLIKHTNPEIPFDSLPDVEEATTYEYRPIFDDILGRSDIIGPITANVLVIKG